MFWVSPIPRENVFFVDTPEAFTHSRVGETLLNASLVGLDAEWRPSKLAKARQTPPRVSILQVACRTRICNLTHNQAQKHRSTNPVKRLVPEHGDTPPEAAFIGDVSQHHGGDITDPDWTEVVYILDLLQLDASLVVAALSSLFNNPSVLKLGFSFRDDLKMLQCTYSSHRDVTSCLQVHPYIDVGSLYAQMKKKNLIDAHMLPMTRRQRRSASILPTPSNSLSDLTTRLLGHPLDKKLQCSDWESRPLSASQIQYASDDATCLLYIFDALMTHQPFIPQQPTPADAARGGQDFPAYDPHVAAETSNVDAASRHAGGGADDLRAQLSGLSLVHPVTVPANGCLTHGSSLAASLGLRQLSGSHTPQAHASSTDQAQAGTLPCAESAIHSREGSLEAAATASGSASGVPGVLVRSRTCESPGVLVRVPGAPAQQVVAASLSQTQSSTPNPKHHPHIPHHRRGRGKARHTIAPPAQSTALPGHSDCSDAGEGCSTSAGVSLAGFAALYSTRLSLNGVSARRGASDVSTGSVQGNKATTRELGTGEGAKAEPGKGGSGGSGDVQGVDPGRCSNGGAHSADDKGARGAVIMPAPKQRRRPERVDRQGSSMSQDSGQGHVGNQGRAEARTSNPALDGWTGPAPWEVGPSADGKPKFLCDIMVEGLARQLRCVGIDAASPPSMQSMDPRELMEWVEREGRVLLTRDSKLLRRKLLPRESAYRVQNKGKQEQLKEVLEVFRITISEDQLLTRCVRCNGDFIPRPLSVAQALADAPKSIPPCVQENVTEFWKCSKCGHLYWEGSQFDRAVKQFGSVCNHLKSKRELLLKNILPPQAQFS